MGNSSNVRIVNSHPKGDRGNDDRALPRQPLFLNPLARPGLHARMVRRRHNLLLDQKGGQIFGVHPASDIDDLRLVPTYLPNGLQKSALLVRPVAAFHDAEKQVWAIERRHEHQHILEPELADNIFSRLGRGRAGQSQNRAGPEISNQFDEPHVRGAEIVPPETYAVDLVDHQQLGAKPLQPLAKGGVLQTFRRDV